MSSNRTFLVSVGVSVLAAACGAPTESDESTFHEMGGDAAVGRQTEPIINATDFTGESADDRRKGATVRVFNLAIKDAGCSTHPQGTGILLENGIVLTAAHMISKPNDCNLSAPFTVASTSQIYVYSAYAPITDEPPTCSDGTCAQPASGGLVVNSNGTDTGLIFLSKRIAGWGGFPFGHFVGLYPFDESYVVGKSAWCSGYGMRSCDDPTWPTALGIGHSMVLSGNDSTLLLTKDSSGQLPWKGDSGGPCWTQWWTDTWPFSVIGVNSFGDCVFTETQMAPQSFRYWVRSQVSAKKPVANFGFASSSEITWWGRYNPSTGTTANWSVQNGRLVESTDAGGTEPDGPMIFSVLDVYDNLDASVKVRSSDNDAAGIVFRYVDPTHFYFLYVRPETHAVKIYKCKNGAFTALGSGTTQITWSSTTDVTLEVLASDYTFTGYINGTQVVQATDTEYPVGHTGIYKWQLASASFDDFKVTPKGPASNGNWPHP